MKRFLVFAGFDTYPRGGVEDCYAACFTIEEAEQHVYAAFQRYRGWVHVLDLVDGKVLRYWLVTKGLSLSLAHSTLPLECNG